MKIYIHNLISDEAFVSGFGGLEVSVLASGTRVRGFKPGQKKILSTPSFGGEVKPSVPCRKFTARKRTQKWSGNLHFRQNSRRFLAHSSTFRCWGSLASFQAQGTPGGGSWNVLITGPPGWGFDESLEKPSCWEYSTIVEQAKTHEGWNADWRSSLREHRVLFLWSLFLKKNFILLYLRWIKSISRNKSNTFIATRNKLRSNKTTQNPLPIWK